MRNCVRQVHVTDMIRGGPVLHASDIEQLKAFAEHSTLHVGALDVSSGAVAYSAALIVAYLKTGAHQSRRHVLEQCSHVQCFCHRT